jgi:hypothetical protein
VPGCCRDDYNVALGCLPVRRRPYARGAVGAKGHVGKVFNPGVSHTEINVNEKQLAGDGVEREIVSNNTADFADANNCDTRIAHLQN